MHNKPHTTEARKKMSDAHRGLRHTKEARKKISIGLTGRPGSKGPNNPKWKGGEEHKKTYNRQWQRNNKKLVSLYALNYMRKRKGAIGSYTLDEWEKLKTQYGFRCPACERVEPTVKLEADHIVPISKGGSNFIENIQPLCRSCNAKKHTKVHKFDY